jgi:hypothetical protein
VLWFLGMTGPIRGRARHSGGVSDATQKVEPVFFGSKKNSFQRFTEKLLQERLRLRKILLSRRGYSMALR